MRREPDVADMSTTANVEMGAKFTTRIIATQIAGCSRRSVIASESEGTKLETGRKTATCAIARSGAHSTQLRGH